GRSAGLTDLGGDGLATLTERMRLDGWTATHRVTAGDGGLAVLSRTTSTVGSNTWRTRGPAPDRERSMAAVRAAAAAWPLAATSWRTVVSAGRMRWARGLSSNPTTDRSSGTM